MRSETIGDCTLYLADCREVLPNLSPVDAVVTDPPYSVSVKGAKNVSPNGTRNFDFFAGDDDWEAMTSLVDQALSLAADLDPKNFVSWCGHRQIGPIVKSLEDRGYSTRLLFWRKRCPPPSAPGSGFAGAMEQAVYAYKAGRPWNGGQYEANVFDADNYRHGQPGKVDHPTQKPVSLIHWNVSLLSNVGDTVLDPFMGSGTTAEVCALTDRKFIGCEVHEPYFDIVCRRVEAAYRQPRLFAEPERKKAIQEALAF